MVINAIFKNQSVNGGRGSLVTEGVVGRALNFK